MVGCADLHKRSFYQVMHGAFREGICGSEPRNRSIHYQSVSICDDTRIYGNDGRRLRAVFVPG